MTMEIIAYPSGIKMAPAIVNGYEATRSSRTITHEVLATGAVDVTIRPAAPRRGTLRLVFRTEAQALAAATQHSGANYFRMGDTDLPTIGMQYVVNGDVTWSLDDETRKVWIVLVPFQEYPRA